MRKSGILRAQPWKSHRKWWVTVKAAGLQTYGLEQGTGRLFGKVKNLKAWCNRIKTNTHRASGKTLTKQSPGGSLGLHRGMILKVRTHLTS